MRNKISKNEKIARQNVIIEKIREGYSRKRLVTWVEENFGFTYQYSWQLVSDAYKALAETNNDELVEATRAIQLERTESILKDCIERGDRKTALKALDIINRLNSLYVERREIDVKSSDLTFKLE